MNDVERIALRRTLRAEAQEKLKGTWRGEAVEYRKAKVGWGQAQR